MARLYDEDSEFWTEDNLTESEEEDADDRFEPLACSALSLSGGATEELPPVLPSLTSLIPPPIAPPPLRDDEGDSGLKSDDLADAFGFKEGEGALAEPRESSFSASGFAEEPSSSQGLNFLKPGAPTGEAEGSGDEWEEKFLEDYKISLWSDDEKAATQDASAAPPKTRSFALTFELPPETPEKFETSVLPQPHLDVPPPRKTAEGALPGKEEQQATGGEGGLKARRFIRKRWYIEDKTDVTCFRRLLRQARRERDAAAQEAAASSSFPEGTVASRDALEEKLRAPLAPPPTSLFAISSAETLPIGDGKNETLADAATDAERDLTPEEEPLAIEFGFELDDFQKRAILRLEKNQTLLVAAHTSAGKTVVAEYAIALALRRNRRCIFTSPLKALSNQKFREFKEKFGTVGLITGDICVNPNASCLIVTTEILRSILFRGDEIIGQLDCVVFDEAHYISDPDRGVVWEESIILLPNQINIVMLSATLPNYEALCEWVGSLKRREVFAVATVKRPVPLRHYLYTNEKLYLLVDADGTFNTNAYNLAYASLQKKKTQQQQPPAAAKAAGASNARGRGGQAGSRGRGRGGAQQSSQNSSASWKKKAFQSEEARVKTEGQRLQVLVSSLRKNCLKRLSPGEAELRQVVFIVGLCRMGIGVHHGGLLPIIKEMVEILFQRGLVRVLFATETLCVGLNLPAKTVVFTQITKPASHNSTRHITAAEYTQELAMMLKVAPQPIRSSFKISYQTLLLSAVHSAGFSMEALMRRSFSEASTFKSRPLLKKEIREIKQTLDEYPPISCVLGTPTVDNFWETLSSWRDVAKELHMKIFNNKRAGGWVFTPGRVVYVHSVCNALVLGIPAVILRQEFTPIVQNEPPTFTVLALLPPGVTVESLREGAKKKKHSRKDDSPFGECSLARSGEVSTASAAAFASTNSLDGFCDVEDGGLEAAFSGEGRQWALRTWVVLRGVSLHAFEAVCDATLPVKGEGSALCDDQVQLHTLASRLEEASAKGTLEAINWREAMSWVDFDFVAPMLRYVDLRKALMGNKCFGCDLNEQHLRLEKERRDLEARRAECEALLSNKSLDLFSELNVRRAVLKRLGFVDEEGRATVKNLSPEEIASVLSAFVGCEREVDEVPVPTPNVQEARQQVIDLHTQILVVQKQMGLRVADEDWWKLCNFQLSLVAFEWAKGAPFSAVMKLTSLHEGSVVRSILRLDELLRKIRQALLVLGDVRLADLLQEASLKIRRDIIFTSSLYIH